MAGLAVVVPQPAAAARPAPERSAPGEEPLGNAGQAVRANGFDAAPGKANAASMTARDVRQAEVKSGAEAAPRATAALDAPPPNFAAALAQALPHTAAAPDPTPAPANAQVNAPLHSPAFAPELAASVSLMAVGGVQHAELQLNPAEMGPVAVSIVVDGAQAQVSFHAAQADTRQALEQTLPDLAAALQGQGLTLSGGGVFQQSSNDARRGNEGNTNADNRSPRAAGAPVRVGASIAPAAASARRAVGLLDTFA